MNMRGINASSAPPYDQEMVLPDVNGPNEPSTPPHSTTSDDGFLAFSETMHTPPRSRSRCTRLGTSPRIARPRPIFDTNGPPISLAAPASNVGLLQNCIRPYHNEMAQKSPNCLIREDSQIRLRAHPATPRTLLHRDIRPGMTRKDSIVLGANDCDSGDDYQTNLMRYDCISPKRGPDESRPFHAFSHPSKKTFSVVQRYKQEYIEKGILGQGDFGTVYKCEHRLDGMTYAIKKSRKEIAGLAEEQRLLREVIAHAELQSHPYIVRYFSAWEEDNHMIIQNEYCQGGTLARLFEKHYNRNIYFHERTLITILKHLALASQALHSRNLAHMDIKPANILIKFEQIADDEQRCHRDTVTTTKQNNSMINGNDDDVFLPESSCLNDSLTSRHSDSYDTVDNSQDHSHDTEIMSSDECDSKNTSTTTISSSIASLQSTPHTLRTSKFYSGSSTKKNFTSHHIFGTEDPTDDDFILQDLLLSDKEINEQSIRRVIFKLGDLGLVTQADLRKVDEGDSRYLAREILKETFKDLTKADIFSMGCTLYELASLKPLAGNGSEWHRLRDNPAPLEKYSKDFCRLIFAMLDENPNTRPTCQDILQEQIVSPSQSISMLKEANKRIAELENTVRLLKQGNHQRDLKRLPSCAF